MKVHIEVRCDNDAFGESDDDKGHELARILRDLADRVERYGPNGPERIRDANGNQVGSMVVT